MTPPPLACEASALEAAKLAGTFLSGVFLACLGFWWTNRKDRRAQLDPLIAKIKILETHTRESEVKNIHLGLHRKSLEAWGELAPLCIHILRRSRKQRAAHKAWDEYRFLNLDGFPEPHTEQLTAAAAEHFSQPRSPEKTSQQALLEAAENLRKALE